MAMNLLEVLAQFGFDPECKARMARHQDNRPGIDFEELVGSQEFEDYQAWQARPVFHDADFVVSFIGDGAGRARFWGVYRVHGYELVPHAELPGRASWPWKKEVDHFRYKLERLPDYEPLVDKLVIAWSSERTWPQYLKDNEVLECPPLYDIDLPDWGPLFAEGNAFTRLVVSRQRSSEARKKCLEIHGCTCGVCGMSFPEQYGGLGMGFMHVHHRTSVASQSGEYEVSPKDDLRPVCPNCHAMLHWNVEIPRTIEELRQLIRK